MMEGWNWSEAKLDEVTLDSLVFEVFVKSFF